MQRVVKTAETLRKIIVARDMGTEKGQDNNALPRCNKDTPPDEIARSSSMRIIWFQTDSSVSFALSPPGPMPDARSFQSIHSQSSE